MPRSFHSPAGFETDGAPDRFGPRFRPLRRLGAGGMGVVYEAEDLERNLRVALKSLSLLDAERLYFLKNEFRALADITHPNLVTLYELISEGAEWFFTMELVEGVDFLQYARGCPPVPGPDGSGATLSPTETCASSGPVFDASGAPLADAGQMDRLRKSLLQLAEGVSALHAAGKLHRDIKPSNILVTGEGRTVLVDFGLATDFGVRPGGVENHFIAGTVAYMAPEQAQGLPLTEAADWYCVGAMLFEALTGRLPFLGNQTQILEQKARGDPRHPQEIAPAVDPQLAEICHALLRRRPEERLTGSDLLRRLGVEARATVAPSRLLVGREREARELREALAELVAGRPGVVLIHGQPGIGKSHLVERFFEESSGQSSRVVLRGRCYEQESVPYKALDSLIDSLAQYLTGLPPSRLGTILPRDSRILARVFPVLLRVLPKAPAGAEEAAIVDQQEFRRRAARALRELFKNLGRQQTLILYVDDLHWGDVDSALLIRELLRPPGPPQVLLVATYRTEHADTSACLKLLLSGDERLTPSGDLSVRRLPLEPLDAGEVRDLALRLLGPGHAVEIDRIATETGGNPYFVQELVESVRAGTDWSTSRDFASLHQALWERIRRLPADSFRLLETIAVAGHPTARSDIYAASGFASRNPAVLAALRTGRLVRTGGPADTDKVETYHDCIRETVVARMAAGDVEQRHLRLAETLESAPGVEPELLAVHYHRGGRPVKAVVYYAATGDQAVRALAFEHAAEMYRQALGLGVSDPNAVRQIQVKLADALANAGRGPEAAAEYERALAGAPADEALELQRRAAYQYCISGHMEQGRTTARQVLAQTGMWLARSETQAIAAWLAGRLVLKMRGLRFRARPESSVPTQLLRRIDTSFSTAVGLTMVDVIPGAAVLTRSLLLALKSGEPYRIARALALEAIHSANLGSPAAPRTRRLLDAATKVAAGIGNAHAAGLLDLAHAIAHFEVGEWSASRSRLAAAETIFREQCTGVFWELATTHAFTLWGLIDLGEYAELARRSFALLEEARGRGDRLTATNIGIFIGPHALLAADRPDEARAMVDEYLAQWTRQESSLQGVMSLMCHNYLDLYRGEGRRAWERLRGQWRHVKRSRLMHSQLMRIFMYFTRGRSALAASREVNDPAPFFKSAAADARRLEREAVPWALPHAQLLRAALRFRQGDCDGAVRLLGDAMSNFERVEMWSFVASCRWVMAALRKGGEGRALKNQAAQWMRDQLIANPAAFAAFHACGFEE